MEYFATRYKAQAAHPDAKICRLIKGDNQGDFIAFYDWITYRLYKREGLVR